MLMLQPIPNGTSAVRVRPITRWPTGGTAGQHWPERRGQLSQSSALASSATSEQPKDRILDSLQFVNSTVRSPSNMRTISRKRRHNGACSRRAYYFSHSRDSLSRLVWFTLGFWSEPLTKDSVYASFDLCLLMSSPGTQNERKRAKNEDLAEGIDKRRNDSR